MLRAAKTKSPREVEILDMGQRILQPPPTYLHSLSKLSRTSNTFIFLKSAKSLEFIFVTKFRTKPYLCCVSLTWYWQSSWPVKLVCVSFPPLIFPFPAEQQTQPSRFLPAIKSQRSKMEWWAILLIVLAVCLITRGCCKFRSTNDEEVSNDPNNRPSQPPVYGSQPPVYGSEPPDYGSQPPVYGFQPPDYGSGNFTSPPPAYNNADGSASHYQNYALPTVTPSLNVKMPSYPPSYEESLHMWLNSSLLNKVITRPWCSLIVALLTAHISVLQFQRRFLPLIK